MGRTLTITVSSARDLRNADEDEGGQSDPFVLVCLDNKVTQELGRTETVENSANPEWEHTFEVDVTPHIEKAIEETGEEPQMLTFCVYDGDENESEPLGVAGVSFTELLKNGKFEGEIPVFLGTGFITVAVQMKKVKKDSMLKSDAALKIAGGVLGAAAIGGIGYYLYNRYQKKKEKLQESEDEPSKTGMAYGADVDDDDDDEEERGNMNKWWAMQDEDDDDDNENKWSDEE